MFTRRGREESERARDVRGVYYVQFADDSRSEERMAGRSRDGGSVRKLTVCLVYLLTLLGELSVSYVGVPALLSFSLSLLYFFLSCGLSLSLVITILPPLLLLLATMSPYQSLSYAPP